MHYRISTPKNESAAKVLMDVREWLANDAGMQQDRKRLDRFVLHRSCRSMTWFLDREIRWWLQLYKTFVRRKVEQS